MSTDDRIKYSDQIIKIVEQLTHNQDDQLRPVLLVELRDCCNLIGRRVPDIDLIRHDTVELTRLITSLRATAKVIASTIENETVDGEEAFSLISTIADRIEAWMEQHKEGFERIRHQ